jgi:CRP/FNR family transcriptional regulator
MFSGLSQDQLEDLADVAVPRSYGAGEVVFREGDEGNSCYVVQSGSLKATKAHADGRTIALTELRPGDMFGELALFSGELRSATIEAVEPTSAVALLAEDIRRLLLGEPEIAIKMLASLADRVRRANERIASQSFQSVPGRVASVLLGQIESRRREGADEDGGLVITATQSDIAQLAGSSRESASRFLATLERASIVTLQRGRIVVHEPDALRNYIY